MCSRYDGPICRIMLINGISAFMDIADFNQFYITRIPFLQEYIFKGEWDAKNYEDWDLARVDLQDFIKQFNNNKLL